MDAEKKRYEISISKLTKTFPGFIWVDRCLELCGWNPVTHQWIVIEDGMCVDNEGEWVVTIYQLSDNERPIQNNYKYCEHDKIIEQERYKLIW